MLDIREKYNTFIYKDYKVIYNEDKINVTYVYKISDYEFKPVVTIYRENIANKNIDKNFLEYLFFNFGIINAINYYKLTIAKKFIIECGSLNKEQK